MPDEPTSEFDLSDPVVPEPTPEPTTADIMRMMQETEAKRAKEYGDLRAEFARPTPDPEPEARDPNAAPEEANQYQYNLAMNAEIKALKDDLRSMDGGKYKNAP